MNRCRPDDEAQDPGAVPVLPSLPVARKDAGRPAGLSPRTAQSPLTGAERSQTRSAGLGCAPGACRFSGPTAAVVLSAGGGATRPRAREHESKRPSPRSPRAGTEARDRAPLLPAACPPSGLSRDGQTDRTPWGQACDCGGGSALGEAWTGGKEVGSGARKTWTGGSAAPPEDVKQDGHFACPSLAVTCAHADTRGPAVHKCVRTRRGQDGAGHAGDPRHEPLATACTLLPQGDLLGGATSSVAVL